MLDALIIILEASALVALFYALRLHLRLGSAIPHYFSAHWPPWKISNLLVGSGRVEVYLKANTFWALGFFFHITATLLMSTPSAGQVAPPPDHAAAIQEMYEGYQSEFLELPTVGSDSLMAWMECPDIVLVDMREGKEQVVSMIPGAITQKTYEADSSEYSGMRIVAYCTIGYRSGKFAEELIEEGLDAYNLDAGILGWILAGGSLINEGKPTTDVHVYGSDWNLVPAEYSAQW